MPRELEVNRHKHIDYSNGVARARFFVRSKMNLKDFKKWAYERYDTHCQHSYDCCGNWYSQVAKIIKQKKGYTVSLVSYQNI